LCHASCQPQDLGDLRRAVAGLLQIWWLAPLSGLTISGVVSERRLVEDRIDDLDKFADRVVLRERAVVGGPIPLALDDSRPR
jgi:hypothetical protein